MPPFDCGDLADLAAELLSESDETITAQSIVDRAAVLLEAEHVSMTIAAAQGGHTTLASTSGLAAEADALQYSLGEGPCLEVVDTAHWFRSGDVCSDPRWAVWGPEAGTSGLRSVLAVRLVTHDASANGALTFYSTVPDEFCDPAAIDLAQVYSVHAASALSSAQLVSGLQTALTSRHAIGMAQGILMERYGLNQQRSFELLRRTSSVHNIKLREVAASLAETGRLPDRPKVIEQPQPDPHAAEQV